MLHNSFGSLEKHRTADGDVHVYALEAVEREGLGSISRLPFSIRVLLESLLRGVDGRTVREADVAALAAWNAEAPARREVPFRPARVILQDFTGVPALVDLAAMRSALARMGGDPARINPKAPVDLVIDHSVVVDSFGTPMAARRNAAIEFERNQERYRFLRWGAEAFPLPGRSPRHRHRPPGEPRAPGQGGHGDGEGDERVLLPDTLVGTDSHTTMINGLGVLGWGVGGIEAEAAMLGQPCYLITPKVVGFRLSGALQEGVTATDLVLTITERLRAHGVVESFVEFFGEGLSEISLSDRATVANMAPEYGATMGFFPVDAETLSYLRRTGRSDEEVGRVEAYAKRQGLFRTDATPGPGVHRRARTRSRNGGAESRGSEAAAGPGGALRHAARLPRVPDRAGGGTGIRPRGRAARANRERRERPQPGPRRGGDRGDHLLHEHLEPRRDARRRPSRAAGGGARAHYPRSRQDLARAGVEGGDRIPAGRGTARPPRGSRLPPGGLRVHDLHREQRTVAGAGGAGHRERRPGGGFRPFRNRNFEGRVHASVRANYLASPPLVVAYALAGTVDIDLDEEPLGTGADGNPVFLRDVWPSSADVRDALDRRSGRRPSAGWYGNVWDGNPTWNEIPVDASEIYPWDEASTYIQEPPFFSGMTAEPAPPADIRERGCSSAAAIRSRPTTSHPPGPSPSIRPPAVGSGSAGSSAATSTPYGSRRGNDGSCSAAPSRTSGSGTTSPAAPRAASRCTTRRVSRPPSSTPQGGTARRAPPS